MRHAMTDFPSWVTEPDDLDIHRRKMNTCKCRRCTGYRRQRREAWEAELDRRTGAFDLYRMPGIDDVLAAVIEVQP